MADEPTPSAPKAPIARTTRPLSESLLNDKVPSPQNRRTSSFYGCDRSIPDVPQVSQHRWDLTRNTLANSSASDFQWDHCVSSLLIRSGLGLGFGVIFSVLLFKRRAWPAWVGLGFGAGRAVEECDNVRAYRHSFKADEDNG